jgi:hypothetical protein
VTRDKRSDIHIAPAQQNILDIHHKTFLHLNKFQNTTSYHQLIRTVLERDTLSKMEALIPIHLPWFIHVHAWNLTALGLFFLFKSHSPGKPAGHTPQLGVATIAIGVAYLFTAYMPIEENQWLHASVPVRVLLAGLLITRALFGKGLTSEEKQSLINLAVYDGLGGVILGLWLGKWNGRLPSPSF